jgi:hypothetical protein
VDDNRALSISKFLCERSVKTTPLALSSRSVRVGGSGGSAAFKAIFNNDFQIEGLNVSIELFKVVIGLLSILIFSYVVCYRLYNLLMAKAGERGTSLKKLKLYTLTYFRPKGKCLMSLAMIKDESEIFEASAVYRPGICENDLISIFRLIATGKYQVRVDVDHPFSPFPIKPSSEMDVVQVLWKRAHRRLISTSFWFGKITSTHLSLRRNHILH